MTRRPPATRAARARARAWYVVERVAAVAALVAWIRYDHRSWWWLIVFVAVMVSIEVAFQFPAVERAWDRMCDRWGARIGRRWPEEERAELEQILALPDAPEPKPRSGP